VKGKRRSSSKPPFLRRHRWLRRLLLVVLVIMSVLVGAGVAAKIRTDRLQARLAPFYSTFGLVSSGAPGVVVRQEALSSSVPNGHGVRVLYRTQRADGSATFSSGVVYIPDHLAAGKPVVAWAHGTLGLGDQCAPSRTSDPPGTVPGLAEMMANGWVVSATDYAGFGTPGISGYLVGGDEAHDVLNSVRAARSLTGASNELVVWGHSQGGNSALFTASEAASYAPELHLAGTVASAPAAELIPLLNQEYGTAIDWVIGPLLAESWPAANPALHASDILTPLGLDTYQTIANQCILPSTVEGLARTVFHQSFFTRELTAVPTWDAMAKAQTAPILSPNQPLLIVESKVDKVVLPNTTSLYISQTCTTGSKPTTLWLDKAAHQQIPAQSATQVISWIGARLSGQPVTNDCGQALPVAPYRAN
jgi:alpha-beta hydrolase superfamily lysophospholipase